MKPFLTPAQVTYLEGKHRVEEKRKVADRIKAVLLTHEGWTQEEIATALRICEDSVARHVKDYVTKHKITLESGGSESKLSDEQTAELVKDLEDKTYPDAASIASFVKEKFDVAYTVSGMTAWLHAHEFSYKQPSPVPAKANLQEQEQFKKAYQKLLQKKDKNDVVLFLDATHPTMSTKITHGWIRTGTSKTIATTGSRTRVNMLGSLDLKSMKFVGSEYKTINSEAMQDHFSALRKEYPKAKTIHVILDNGSYNKSVETKKAARKNGINLVFLPAYSPNLNAIERLWKVLNEEVRDNVFFHDAKEFREQILEFFTSTWPKIGPKMRGRINDNFQTLNPAF